VLAGACILYDAVTADLYGSGFKMQ